MSILFKDPAGMTTPIPTGGGGQTIQVTTMPAASASNVDFIYQYIGATTQDYINGFFYKCISDGLLPATYSWVNIDVQNSSGGQTIQVDTLPVASATELGNIYQFVGTSTSTLTNGYFYRCVSDGVAYSWEEVEQPPLCPIWTGTRAEYNAAKIAGTVPNDIMVAITDESGSGGGVSSVNGMTGDVVLTATDVGALPDNTSIPSKTSDLTNDSNFAVDASYVHTDNNYTTAEKTKLSGIAAGAKVNVQPDWSQTDTDADDYIKNKPTIPSAQVNADWTASSGVAEILHKPTLGTAAAKDSTNAVTANSTDLVESGAVKSAIDNAVACAYHHAGTSTVAGLTSSLLVATNEGNVYNITDNGTTTADFIEGAGVPIRAGDNVGIAKVATDTYKFDLLSGFIDTSNKADKVANATANHLAKLDANGNLVDSGIPAENVATTTDLATKEAAILQTATLTLATTDWTVQTITNDLTNTTTTSLPEQRITLYPTYNFKYNSRNVIDITLGEEQDWADNNVHCTGGLPIVVNEITYLQNVRFQADTIPSKNLTFRVTSMEVS